MFRFALACLIVTSPALGQSFNIDFGIPEDGPDDSYRAAGLPGFWNSVEGEHTTPSPGPQPFDYILRDLAGNSTAVRLHQFGGMDLISVPLGGPGEPTGDDERLLRDAIVTHSIPLKSCLYFNGLQNGTYEVLMYTWMPEHPEVDSVSFIDFTPGQQIAGGAWPGGHQEGVTYTRFIVNVTNGFMGPHAGLPDNGNPVIGGPLNAIQLRLLCGSADDCGDANDNGITDDACAFHECLDQECQSTPRAFADLGGSFGACAPDGFVNVHDRNHALACFSNSTTCADINLDAGGSFGSCAPDGFCNVHDVAHTLEVFAGTSTCSCGPQPDLPPAPVAGAVDVELSAEADSVRPGGTVRVHALLSAVPKALHSYQLFLEATGGRRGHLELIAIDIEPHRAAPWPVDADTFSAVNIAAGAVLAGRSDTAAGAHGRYLATFTYRASRHADGEFVIDAVVDDRGTRSAFIAHDHLPLAIERVTAATITVHGALRRR